LGAVTIAVLEAARALVPSDRAHDAPGVWRGLEAFLAASGVAHYLAAVVPLPGIDLRTHVLRTNWPEAWFERYMRDALWRTDPLYTGAVGSRIALEEAALREATRDLPRSHEVLEHYAAAGLTGHGAVPCLVVGAYQLFVILSAGRTLSTDEFHVVAAMTRIMVQRLYEVAPDLFARHGQLTPRERQIVGLTAQGFTSNEIADDLGISARTVFAHLTSAGDKLHAANKTETVVNAYRYGQIAM